MKIEHRTKRRPAPAPRIRTRVDDFLDAFIADHAADPSKLPPRLRAFVQQQLAKDDKNAR